VHIPFSSPKCPDWFWGPPSLLFNGYWGSFLGVKWPGCKFDHSPSVQIEWSYTYTPSEHGQNHFMFYFYYSEGNVLKQHAAELLMKLNYQVTKLDI